MNVTWNGIRCCHMGLKCGPGSSSPLPAAARRPLVNFASRLAASTAGSTRGGGAAAASKSPPLLIDFLLLGLLRLCFTVLLISGYDQFSLQIWRLFLKKPSGFLAFSRRAL
jgi:hypothetical protein